MKKVMFTNLLLTIFINVVLILVYFFIIEWMAGPF